MKNIKKNYVYNLIYQILTVIIPLITTPYISRVLNADGMGVYSFSNAVIAYFNMFASLGFSIYGQREIAKYQGDTYKQSKIFWEIMIIKFCSTLITIILFISVIQLNVFEKYKNYLVVMIFNIISVSLSSTFLFQGNEQFKAITIRDIIVKVILTISIFIFVKSEKDLSVYCFINAFSPFLSAIIMMPIWRKFIKKIKLNELTPIKHLLPTLRLFIPTIASSIYILLDRTLIGLLISGETVVIRDGLELVVSIADLENGYYEQSDKIVKMALMLILCLNTIMMPRNANEFALGRLINVKNNINKSIQFTLFLGIPMMFGLMAISNNLVPWFFGSGYEKVVLLLKCLSVLIIIIGMNNLIGQQYLIPIKEDKKYIVSIILGSSVNLLLNLILIPHLYSLGAVISSIIAELCILIYQLILIKNEIRFLKIVKNNWRYLISGFIMFCLLVIIDNFMTSCIINTFILIFTGIIFYLVLLMIFKDSFLKTIIKKIKCKSRKIKN